MIRRAGVALAAMVLFAGCAPTAEPRGFLGRLWHLEVGPDYRRPGVDMPDDFRGRLGPAEAESFADLPWWQVFGDAVLQDLIGRALAGNYNLQRAVASVEQARAQVGIAASQLYPQLGYQGSAERQKIFFTPNFPSTTFNLFQGALNVAWEIDLWGRIRRATEAARAQFWASEEARRGVVITLVSDVATGYFQLLELERQLAIAHESEETYRRTGGVHPTLSRRHRHQDLDLACGSEPAGEYRVDRRAAASDHAAGRRDQRAARHEPGADRARHSAGRPDDARDAAGAHHHGPPAATRHP